MTKTEQTIIQKPNIVDIYVLEDTPVPIASHPKIIKKPIIPVYAVHGENGLVLNYVSLGSNGNLETEFDLVRLVANDDWELSLAYGERAKQFKYMRISPGQKIYVATSISSGEGIRLCHPASSGIVKEVTPIPAAYFLEHINEVRKERIAWSELYKNARTEMGNRLESINSDYQPRIKALEEQARELKDAMQREINKSPEKQVLLAFEKSTGPTLRDLLVEKYDK
ncbi:MAG: hypothetical protein ABIG89_06645 [Candidatus Woesearchaeota archaeon]